MVLTCGHAAQTDFSSLAIATPVAKSQPGRDRSVPALSIPFDPRLKTCTTASDPPATKALPPSRVQATDWNASPTRSACFTRPLGRSTAISTRGVLMVRTGRPAITKAVAPSGETEAPVGNASKVVIRPAGVTV